MADTNRIHIINTLRKKWVTNTVLSAVLLAAGCSFVPVMLLHKLLGISLWWAAPVFVLACIITLFVRRSWQTTNTDVARFLNKKYPSLEESCELLLKPADELNLLETLQVAKTTHALQSITRPNEFVKPLRTSALTLLLACVVSVGLALVPFTMRYTAIGTTNTNDSKNAIEKILPGIKSTNITITPPAYTRIAAKKQTAFNLHVEEGAVVNWQLNTNTTVSTLKLVFNDSTTLALQPANTMHTAWQASRQIKANGFYQVVMDGVLSEFYKIEMIKDQPPVINVQSPKPNITIDFGEPQTVTIHTFITDDYGVKDAIVMATVASGNGEAVKFKEQKLTFSNSLAAQAKQYQLQKMVDLVALGMHPGDELYFYVQAHDNNGQEKRSDIFIVSIADTAQLMESDVLVGNIKLKPEYFRSQRQIIIETEQLLRDKDTISTEEFNNRSNNLGIDQKLLRLRYGKFLGEEAESGELGSEANDAVGDPSNFGNANTVLDAFTDKHDNAEDASFFNDDIKKQLKATLTEMWNAELRLRTFKPNEALPFEYKALRLLKELQQKSRVYVAKTSYRVAPLKPEKRLTGDLSKILQPQTQLNIAKSMGANEIASGALGILEQLKYDNKVTSEELENLQQAMQLLNNHAATEPGVYLTAMQAQKKIVEALQKNESIQPADIENAEAGLQRIIASPTRLPQKNEALPGNPLQQQYFKNLQKTKQQ